MARVSAIKSNSPGSLGWGRPAALLPHNLDLFIDHLVSETVDSDMNLVALFALTMKFARPVACASSAAFLPAVFVGFPFQQSPTLLGAQIRTMDGFVLRRTASPCSAPLLNHFFELLIDYRSVKTINGDVKPVSFFPFHDEVRKTCGIGFVMPCLCDKVDE